MLRSRYRHLGEPVITAYGVTREGHTLTCGLLFIREHLLAEPEGYVMHDPETGEEINILLPPTYLEMGTPKHFIGASLEVFNG